MSFLSHVLGVHNLTVQSDLMKSGGSALRNQIDQLSSDLDTIPLPKLTMADRSTRPQSAVANMGTGISVKDAIRTMDSKPIRRALGQKVGKAERGLSGSDLLEHKSKYHKEQFEKASAAEKAAQNRLHRTRIEVDERRRKGELAMMNSKSSGMLHHAQNSSPTLQRASPERSFTPKPTKSSPKPIRTTKPTRSSPLLKRADQPRTSSPMQKQASSGVIPTRTSTPSRGKSPNPLRASVAAKDTPRVKSKMTPRTPRVAAVPPGIDGRLSEAAIRLAGRLSCQWPA